MKNIVLLLVVMAEMVGCGTSFTTTQNPIILDWEKDGGGEWYVHCEEQWADKNVGRIIAEMEAKQKAVRSVCGSKISHNNVEEKEGWSGFGGYLVQYEEGWGFVCARVKPNGLYCD